VRSHRKAAEGTHNKQSGVNNSPPIWQPAC
jgi:hypothetical protein